MSSSSSEASAHDDTAAADLAGETRHADEALPSDEARLSDESWPSGLGASVRGMMAACLGGASKAKPGKED
jgi:hypothetical protein